MHVTLGSAVLADDGGEPLMDVRELPGLRLDRRRTDALGSAAWMRVGVVERLLAAQAELPHGLRLLVLEGYRPPHEQRRRFDAACVKARHRHPDWSDALIRRAASRVVTPPEFDPHGTGGAVDLTLCTESGVELALGGVVRPAMEPGPAVRFTGASESGDVLRATLSRALADAGFVGAPGEYWHWSFGDAAWAMTTGARRTLYSPVSSATARRTTKHRPRLAHPFRARAS